MNVAKKERPEVSEGHNLLLSKWYLKDCMRVSISSLNGLGPKVICKKTLQTAREGENKPLMH